MANHAKPMRSFNIWMVGWLLNDVEWLQMIASHVDWWAMMIDSYDFQPLSMDIDGFDDCCSILQLQPPQLDNVDSPYSK